MPNIYSSCIFFCTASSFKHIADSQSFLFTLINPSGREPIKITPKAGAGIWCNSDDGPCFGTAKYDDLRVRSDYGVSSSSYCDLGHGFTCPHNVNKKTYFAGKSPFDISELEVFKVN